PHAKAISRARLGIASYEAPLREVEWLLSQRLGLTEERELDTEPRLDRTIVFDKVSFTYPNGHPALQQVSCSIESGKTTALLGESGSGKTTLVNVLCRLVEPQSGKVRLDNDPIVRFNAAPWRRRFAVAGQDIDLVGGTVAENIAYGRPEATMAEIEAV